MYNELSSLVQVTRGDPRPEVLWRRREGRNMPGTTGEKSIRGDRLTYRRVTRHHSGVYVCEADNGFGDATTKELRLDVQREYRRPRYCIV